MDYDLIEIAVKAHRPTLCLVSALARHELTDIIPSVHDVAVPRGTWRPLVATPVHWHKFDARTFEVGRDRIRLDETHALGLYDAPRSIVDAFRLRHEVGPDIANEALRRWLRQGGKPADLMRMTKTSLRRGQSYCTHFRFCCDSHPALAGQFGRLRGRSRSFAGLR